MKFSITRENFQQGLASVVATIPARTTLPVLSNILLEAEDEGVRISGTDLDISVSVAVPADVEEPGALTVPAKKLQELARELPEQPIHISSKGERFSLVCGKASFKLNGLARDEFPTFPEVDFESGWTVSGSRLAGMIGRTAFAVSTEESRPILNGVLWQMRPDASVMVATNGHRLARIRVAGANDGAPEDDLIVPPKALSQVDRLFAGQKEVRVARTENHLGFRAGGTRVFTRIIEGPYPNYEQVIPKDNDKVARVDTEQLSHSLRRMAVVASDQTHRVRLSFNGPILRFAVETPDLGEASEDLEVDYRGEPLDIGFNANYLLEVLRYMPGEEIRMTFKGPERASTIEPAEQDEETGDYLCLVMPLRLLD
jgi:DNA polymerase-3 subunit beta